MQFNINEFFYNIIPGSVFLLFWYIKVEEMQNIVSSINSLFNNSLASGIMLFIIALSLGLIFHGIWRTVKYFLFKSCKNNTKEYYENAYLWAKNKRELPEYFSSRAAVWCGLIIGLIISIFIVREYWLYYLVFIVILGFMYCADNVKEKNSIKNTYLAVNKDSKK